MKEEKIKEIINSLGEQIKEITPKNIVLMSKETREYFDFGVSTSSLKEKYEESVVLIKLDDLLSVIEETMKKTRARKVEDLINEIETNMIEYAKKNGITPSKTEVVRDSKREREYQRIIKYYINEDHFPFIKTRKLILWMEKYNEMDGGQAVKRAGYKYVKYDIPPQLIFDLSDILLDTLSGINLQELTETKKSKKKTREREVMEALLKIINTITAVEECAKVADIITEAKKEKIEEKEVIKILKDMRKFDIVYESKLDCYKTV